FDEIGTRYERLDGPAAIADRLPMLDTVALASNTLFAMLSEGGALMGNRIYGCDDCLAVCPWNKFAVAASDMRYVGAVGAPPLAELAALDDAAFRARFSGSPIKRIGRDRFVRNVLYAIGNSGMSQLVEAARAHLDDKDPAVADAARWAVERLT
ncbi:MAG: hypothetical protein AAFU63_16690, partial [Pseudomonadota bacterium]